jgi:diacylglycerol O-acyltransferase
MDALSPLDAAFLRLESRDAPLHIAAAALFPGPAPSYREVLELVGSKLDELPRYRQRVREVPLWLGLPVWTDDPAFELTRHVRQFSLPRPGTDEQLRALCARLLSTQLDRRHPLWQAWLVDGLQGDRWALVTKVHHCMVDGVAGFDLLARMLDPAPQAAPPVPQPWAPAPAPGGLRLLASALTSVPGPRAGLRAARAVVTDPERLLRAAAEDVRGLASWAGVLRPAAPSSLTGPLTTRRGWAWAAVPLSDVRRVRQAYGGTVNDVVLALVTGAFRDLLLRRGEVVERRTLRTLVPVSVRARRADDGPATANQVSAVVAQLPVDVADPVERLAAVRAELDRLKASGEVQAGEALTSGAALVPPLLLSAGLFGAFRLPQRNIVTVTTNVPGPRVPLWLLGRRLEALFPFVPIADRVRTGVAITSYDGMLSFGVTADAASVPDVQGLAKGVDAALSELLATLPASEG